MYNGQVQLLRRLRLSSFGKRRSNIDGADGGGAEHQVVGESLAAMTVGTGIFSHLMRTALDREQLWSRKKSWPESESLKVDTRGIHRS